MNEDEQYQKIHFEVLNRVIPKKVEIEKLQNEFENFKRKVAQILLKNNIQATIEAGGSFSRDTWLSGNSDIDIFVKMPQDSETTPEELVKVVQKNIKLKWEKRHANHPYLFTNYNEIDIEIVPCYELELGDKIRSAVDRSPLHREFVTKNLPIGANDEVRLLKQFMKGVGTYGAEIKVHGFSGYLTELLTIYYQGNFLNVLRNAKEFRTKEIYFHENQFIAKKRFENDAMIVIDPTDEFRNVASPIQEDTLAKFIAAAEYYLHKPSLHFFFPKEIEISAQKIKELQNNPLKIVTLVHKKSEVAADVLWGQIRKFEKGLANYLIQNGFQVLFIDSLTIEDKIITVIVTITESIPPVEWKEGPPIENDNQIIFLEKYHKNNSVIHGPIIEDNRWKVLVKRNLCKIEEIIQDALDKKVIALPSYLNLKIKELQILSKEETIAMFQNNQEVMVFIYKALLNKPDYLW
ncbi:MAG: CCA tRNA nucleotidyltransferase [Candidatus Thorarchaeota archaeon]